MYYSERFNKSSYTGEYRLLSQPELIDKLANQGMLISSATLRNWERENLIIPPYRTARRGGKITEYVEFVLAECYAVYTLSQSKQQILNISIPKFSLSQIRNARKILREKNFNLSKYPNIPKDTEISSDYYAFDARSFDKRPDDIPFSNNTSLDEHTFFDMLMSPIIPAPSRLSEVLSIYEERLTMGFWILMLQKGCDIFLSDYRR